MGSSVAAEIEVCENILDSEHILGDLSPLLDVLWLFYYAIGRRSAAHFATKSHKSRKRKNRIASRSHLLHQHIGSSTNAAAVGK